MTDLEKQLADALRNFYAMVAGESPSLLEADCNAEAAREA